MHNCRISGQFCRFEQFWERDAYTHDLKCVSSFIKKALLVKIKRGGKHTLLRFPILEVISCFDWLDSENVSVKTIIITFNFLLKYSLIVDIMETEDLTKINPSTWLADYVKCDNKKSIVEKLLASDVAKDGVDHNLYPISKLYI